MGENRTRKLLFWLGMILLATAICLVQARVWLVRRAARGVALWYAASLIRW